VSLGLPERCLEHCLMLQRPRGCTGRFHILATYFVVLALGHYGASDGGVHVTAAKASAEVCEIGGPNADPEFAAAERPPHAVSLLVRASGLSPVWHRAAIPAASKSDAAIARPGGRIHAAGFVAFLACMIVPAWAAWFVSSARADVRAQLPRIDLTGKALPEEACAVPGGDQAAAIVQRSLSAAPFPCAVNSMWQTVALLLSSTISFGILNVPYAVAQAGYVGFLIVGASTLLLGATLGCVGDVVRQADCMSDDTRMPVNPLARNWDFIGGIAFGRFGRIFMAFVMMGDLYIDVIVSVLMGAKSLIWLIPTHLEWVSISCLLAVVGMLNAFPLRYWARFGSISATVQAFSMAGFLATAMYIWWYGLAANDQTFLRLNAGPAVANSFNKMILPWAAHSEAPLYYHLMRDNRQWRKAVAVTVVITVSTFASLSFVGYTTFGSSLQLSYLLNIGIGLDRKPLGGPAWVQSAWWSISVACNSLFAVKIVVSQPMLFAPIVSVIEEGLGWTYRPLLKRLLGPCLILTTAGCCIASRQYADQVVGIGGAAFGNLASFFCPVVAYGALVAETRVGKCGLLFCAISSLAYACLGVLSETRSVPLKFFL